MIRIIDIVVVPHNGVRSNPRTTQFLLFKPCIARLPEKHIIKSADFDSEKLYDNKLIVKTSKYNI